MKKQLVLAATLTLTACGYAIDKTGGAGADGPTGPVPASQLSFATVMATTIRPVCLECHSAPRNSGGFNLEGYDVFADPARRPTILNAVKSKFMPDSQGRSLTPAQRSLLVAWLEAGAPREAPADGAAPGVPLAPGNPGQPGQPPAQETPACPPGKHHHHGEHLPGAAGPDGAAQGGPENPEHPENPENPETCVPNHSMEVSQ